MSPSVAFFVSLSLFSAPMAFAQSEPEGQGETPVQTEEKEEAFKNLLNVAGLTAFRQVKAVNQQCVSSSVNMKELSFLIPSVLSSLVGSHIGIRNELKASQKFVDSIIQSEMHSANKIYELGKAGSTTPQAKRFPRSKTSKIFSKAGAALLIAWGVEKVYYWTTGKDFFTSSSMNEFMLWTHEKLGRPASNKELAAYYATEKGFQDFLRLDNEQQVKTLMEESPLLVAGTIAISQLVQAAGCGPIGYIGPNNLDEDSKKMLANPSKVEGEEL